MFSELSAQALAVVETQIDSEWPTTSFDKFELRSEVWLRRNLSVLHIHGLVLRMHRLHVLHVLHVLQLNLLHRHEVGRDELHELHWLSGVLNSGRHLVTELLGWCRLHVAWLLKMNKLSKLHLVGERHRSCLHLEGLHLPWLGDTCSQSAIGSCEEPLI